MVISPKQQHEIWEASVAAANQINKGFGFSSGAAYLPTSLQLVEMGSLAGDPPSGGAKKSSAMYIGIALLVAGVIYWPKIKKAMG
jgi:hypothetical protein